MHLTKKKRDLSLTPRERLSDALDMPMSVLGGGSAIELYDAREAVVIGCLSVLEYDPTRVVVRTHGGRISICGETLRMQSLLDDRITVHGRITSIHTEADR